MKFELVSDYTPQGDQPKAIEKLVAGLNENKKHQESVPGNLRQRHTHWDNDGTALPVGKFDRCAPQIPHGK